MFEMYHAATKGKIATSKMVAAFLEPRSASPIEVKMPKKKRASTSPPNKYFDYSKLVRLLA